MILNSFMNHFWFFCLVELYIYIYIIALLQFWEVCIVVIYELVHGHFFSMLAMLSNQFYVSNGLQVADLCCESFYFMNLWLKIPIRGVLGMWWL